jgi:hypothetical protein
MTFSKTVKTDPRIVLQNALLMGDNPDDTQYGGVDSQEALDQLETAIAALHGAHKALVRIAKGAREAGSKALAARLREAIARDLINPANELATSDLAYALAAAAKTPADEG